MIFLASIFPKTDFIKSRSVEFHAASGKLNLLRTVGGDSKDRKLYSKTNIIEHTQTGDLYHDFKNGL